MLYLYLELFFSWRFIKFKNGHDRRALAYKSAVVSEIENIHIHLHHLLYSYVTCNYQHESSKIWITSKISSISFWLKKKKNRKTKKKRQKKRKKERRDIPYIMYIKNKYLHSLKKGKRIKENIKINLNI